MKNLLTISLFAIFFQLNSQIKKPIIKSKEPTPSTILKEKVTVVEDKQSNTKVLNEKKTVLEQNKSVTTSSNAVIVKENISDKKKLLIDSTVIKKDIVVDDQLNVDSMIVPKGQYKLFKKNAHASYYASRFSGRRSASGKTFYNNKYMAAHKKLPFGTILKVTNEINHKSVYVEVVDRGPFVKSRELDLSSRAFREISTSKNAGAVIVTIEILQK